MGLRRALGSMSRRASVANSRVSGARVSEATATRRIMAPSNADEATVEQLALADEKVKGLLDGKTVRKVIVVKGRLLNIVVG